MASGSTLRRALLGALALSLLVGAPARADHTSHDPGGAQALWFQEYGFPGRGSYRPRTRDRCSDECDRRACPEGIPGTPWVVMREYLADAPEGPTWHRHAECWFLRRWPVAKGATPSLAGRACEGLERGVEECPFASAALGEEAAPATTEERLLRGLERFRRGRTKEAAADFRAAAEADPKEPRAVYGSLMSAFVQNRWAEAAKDLRALAALGALDATDRLDTADAFEDPGKMGRIVKGLEAHAHWSFHDDDAQLVLGWALVATGKPEAGRPHLKSALRFRPGDPAAQRLLAGLDAPVAPPR
jgi:hypothetical protein